jgi:hypothetical protein
MTRSTLFFLGTGTLTFVLAAASGLAGCQNGGSGGTGGTGGEGASSTTGTNTTSSSSGNNTTTSSSTSSSTGSSSSGTGGAPQTATITDITKGTIGPKVAVEVKGVVAMSRKFLVSQSKSTGSCLWGVFLSEPGISTTAANSGILALSYGTPAVIPDGGTKAFCPVIEKGDPAGDGFPDDVKPGDVLDVTGKTDSFIQMACGSQPGDSTVPQVQLANVTKATKTGTASVPTPHELSPDEFTSFAGQTDSDFYKKWGGVKVRLKDASPVVVTPDGGAPSIVGDFGIITIQGQGSNLRVGDKAYYQGLLNSLKDPCHEGPKYADNTTTFTKIDGFVYLDFCTWSMEPSNRCVDFAPPSDDCGTETCQ